MVSEAGRVTSAASDFAELDVRVRGVFPLPVPVEFDTLGTAVEGVDVALSRSQKRRLSRRNKRDSWLAEGISTLNSISGIPCDNIELTGAPARNATQVQCLDRIRKA